MATQNVKRKSISYAKWGYIFILPFFAVFAVFTCVPLFSTIYNAFFENYLIQGWMQVGPNYVGLENFESLFAAESDLMKYFGNTFILWILGFIPQIFFSLLFAAWFTDIRLKLKTGAYKIIFYLPNVIMAAAMGMLFFTIFSQSGPVNTIYMDITGAKAPYMFFEHEWSQRGVIALINFLMWYGNTTIMLMAAINGIDTSLYESAQIDGANPSQTFFKITLPLIRPILLYVLITSLIGGLQMYDVPKIVTQDGESLNRTSMTIVMFLQKHLYSKNYGMAGALSVILFVVATVLSILVFAMVKEREPKKKKAKKGGNK
ncbi:MAG: sugar ABC transporter permease [Oscillospiraceae bacterium]|nr:sugar ABC transporter permease [Oscillospiraceae bacterium]